MANSYIVIAAWPTRSVELVINQHRVVVHGLTLIASETCMPFSPPACVA